MSGRSEQGYRPVAFRRGVAPPPGRNGDPEREVGLVRGRDGRVTGRTGRSPPRVLRRAPVEVTATAVTSTGARRDTLTN